MDKSLDDRIAERQPRSRPTAPRRARPTYPRDGVRKSTRDDRANLDNDWVHDRYDDEPSPRDGYSSRPKGHRDDYDDRTKSPEKDRMPPPAKLRVDNLHYDLTEDDLYDLFTRIAPVRDVRLTYDRAGRSDGTAFITYDFLADARSAIREFDGANAKGQPIRLTLLPLPPRSAVRRDNPFDRVENPRSLFDRVEAPSSRGRRRSESPMEEVERDYLRDNSRRGARRGGATRGDRRSNTTKPAPENIDRYIPGQNGRSSSRRDGRRPGERRERVPRETGPGRSGARPKKTAEELDAEMEDYWGAQGNQTGHETATAPSAPTLDAGHEDIDMIE